MTTKSRRKQKAASDERTIQNMKNSRERTGLHAAYIVIAFRWLGVRRDNSRAQCLTHLVVSMSTFCRSIVRVSDGKTHTQKQIQLETKLLPVTLTLCLSLPSVRFSLLFFLFSL